MRGLAILMLFLGLAAQPALADAPAGRWTGSIPASPGCDFDSSATLLTADGVVYGTVTTPQGNFSVEGEIGAEGGGPITVDNNTRGTLKLADGHFILDWSNTTCRRHAELVPTPVTPGPFDGAWQAERMAMRRPCNAGTLLRLVVVGGQVMGVAHAPWRTSRFSADLEADGTGRVLLNGDKGSIRFQGSRFQMGWVSGQCGNEVALGDRVPDTGKLEAMRQDRKNAQSAFLTLKAAAEAGRKVDYTALRAASVHAPEWAFFNNKADGPMSQAKLSAKGGDCTQALANLDQAIGYDFTIDAAHALKADCLRKSDSRAARIEDAIANGLVRSLMRSGDGKSEKTAYVITTGREMADVLANRHIDVRTRQQQTRGSDGHFYEMMQGVQGQSKKLVTIYFNIDAFVVGRQSKRAGPDAPR